MSALSLPVGLLRSLLRSYFDVFLWHAASASRKRRSRGLRGDLALIVPPGTPGSVGDAAMLAGITQALRRDSTLEIVLLNQSGDTWGEDIETDRQVDAFQVLSWFGGRQLLALLPLLRRCRVLYVIGADVIDGTYSPPAALSRVKLMRLAYDFGCEVVLTGCSISEAPNSAVMEALRGLPQGVRLYARDPISQGRLEAQLGRPVALTADCAFLPIEARESTGSVDIASWKAQCRAEGHSIVALNRNALQARKYSALGDALLSVLERLAQTRKIAVLMVPHDTRGEISDVVLAEETKAALERKLERVAILRPPLTPSGTVEAIAGVDLVITGRMHLAILSLGQRILPVSLVYQGKFEGLYRLFALPAEGLLVHPEQVIKDPDVLVRLIDRALGSLATHTATIEAKLPQVLEAAQRNLEGERP